MSIDFGCHTSALIIIMDITELMLLGCQNEAVHHCVATFIVISRGIVLAACTLLL